MDENLIVEKANPGSFPQAYKIFMVGKAGWLELARLELITFLFGGIPGACGFFSRFICYPSLFKRCGGNILFGKGLNLFVPSNICLGNRVILEDGVTLNAKTGGISLSDGVFISRSCYLNSHPDGYINIGPDSGLGLNTIIHGGGGVEIGRDVMISPQCYIISQTYNFSDTEKPIKTQGMKKSKVKIEDDVWVGVGTKILSGVTIGKGSIIGAGSLVNKDIPPYSIAYGAPAKVERKRK